jgi:glycosyltransferase involved in cell wall biosynthesis
MKVSIGITNYNRLFYLRSCVKSLERSLDKSDNVELICVDDGSKEKGTSRYLRSLQSKGWKVIDQTKIRVEKKDSDANNSAHISPFSEALNIIHKESSGDLILPLQGDMQFIRKGWLNDVKCLFSNKDNVGTVVLDAQRRFRLGGVKINHCFVGKQSFFYEPNGLVNGAGDTVYSRKLIESVNGWQLNSETNAEDDFSERVAKKHQNAMVKYNLCIPASIAIYNEQGTNCRIRGGNRYGVYKRARNDIYYKFINCSDYPNRLDRPYSIEEVAFENYDWKLPINQSGDWIKNPLEINELTPFTSI